MTRVRYNGVLAPGTDGLRTFILPSPTGQSTRLGRSGDQVERQKAGELVQVPAGAELSAGLTASSRVLRVRVGEVVEVSPADAAILRTLLGANGRPTFEEV